MNVNPANSAAIQFSMSHELDHFAVGNGPGAVDAIVSRQQFMTASPVSHEQLARYEFVRRNLVNRKQVTQLLCVWRPIGEKSNPNGRVDQNHLRRWRRDSRIFAPPGHVFGIGFASTETSKAVVSGASDESFQAQTNSLGVGGCSTRSFGRVEELIVNVQRLLHAAILPYFHAL